MRLRHEMAGISQSVRARIDLNARSCIEQGKYEREYQGTTERLAELEDRLKCIEVKNSPPALYQNLVGMVAALPEIDTIWRNIQTG